LLPDSTLEVSVMRVELSALGDMIKQIDGWRVTLPPQPIAICKTKHMADLAVAASGQTADATLCSGLKVDVH
jgi:hypothetical protein